MPLPQDLTTHEMCSLLIIQKSEGTLKWLWTLTGKANGWFSLIPGVHCSVPRRFGNIKSAVVGKVLLFSVQAGEHQCCKMCAINKHQRVFPSFGWHQPSLPYLNTSQTEHSLLLGCVPAVAVFRAARLCLRSSHTPRGRGVPQLGDAESRVTLRDKTLPCFYIK